QHALDVDIDRAIPIQHLASFERREGHQAGVVDYHINAPMGLHCMVHEMLDLRVLSHVSLHGGVIAQRKLCDECLKPFETPRSQHQFGPVLSKMTRSSFSKSAACSGDDDHFVFNTLCHSCSL